MKSQIIDHWKRGVYVLAGWSIGALFISTLNILQAYVAQHYHPLWQILLWQFTSAAEWCILTPIIFWLVEKFPIGSSGGAAARSQNLWRNLSVHLIGCVVIVLTREAVDAWIQPKIGFPPGGEAMTYFESFRYIFIVDFHWSIIIYCVALGIIFGTRYYSKFREREIQTLQLEAKLAQAQLRALKMQLHPHFLFNTHNAISELIYKDQAAAEDMLGNLSDLLRFSLDNLETEKIPLYQELDFLRKYLQIEEMRFQDRLSVHFEIDSETLTAVVPNMILQPLVENAVKHGIAPLARGGKINLKAMKKNQQLHLQISDTGAGIDFVNPAEITEGIGLSNTKERLKYLYGEDYVFEIQPNNGCGLKLNLIIPFESVAASRE